MVNNALGVDDLRTIAEILGHSPEMLMTVYSEVLPADRQAIIDRLARPAVS